jgi:hypothetical protein
LQGDERLADLEPEGGIQRQGPAVIRGLAQPHPRTVTLGHPPEHRLHELAPDRAVLDRRIDRDGPHTGNRQPLIQDITADDAAAQLGNDDIVSRVG